MESHANTELGATSKLFKPCLNREPLENTHTSGTREPIHLEMWRDGKFTCGE